MQKECPYCDSDKIELLDIFPFNNNGEMITIAEYCCTECEGLFSIKVSGHMEE
jgi:hypothetical protein